MTSNTDALVSKILKLIACNSNAQLIALDALIDAKVVERDFLVQKFSDAASESQFPELKEMLSHMARNLKNEKSPDPSKTPDWLQGVIDGGNS